MKIHYKNFAFISYSHQDIGFAKWLQRRLEDYKLPTEVHNDINKSRYLRPVFRDQSDLNAGVLNTELIKHLEQSKYLILICSKSSANSLWVSEEAKAFIEMDRLAYIIPIIIPDGITSEREFFPGYLREYFKLHPDCELLGINIGEIGKEKALIRIVSKMLDVSFDSLWKRHQRKKRARIVSASIAAIVALICLYVFVMPVKVTVNVKLQDANLPMGENVILFINRAEYSSSIDKLMFDGISLPQILPGYSRFRNIEIKAQSQFYESLDTLVSTGMNFIRNIDIELHRDNSFGVYSGEITDDNMNPLKDAKVRVNDYISKTDSRGRFSIQIPLSEQAEELPLYIEFPNYIYRYNGSPHSAGRDIKIIMHRK